MDDAFHLTIDHLWSANSYIIYMLDSKGYLTFVKCVENTSVERNRLMLIERRRL